MGSPALHLVDPGAGRHPDLDASWLEWLVAHIDPGWRAGEWDNRLGLFTGDLHHGGYRAQCPGLLGLRVAGCVCAAH